MRRFWLVRLVSFVLAAALPCSALVAQQLQPSKDIPRLESLVRVDSNDAQLHYQLGVAYWSRKRFDDAERSFRTAIAIERRFAAGYLALSYLPYARRKQLFKEQEQGKVPPEWRDALTEADRQRRLAFLINPMVDLQIIGAVVPTNEGIYFGNQIVIVLDPFSAFVRGNYRTAYGIFNEWVTEQEKKKGRDSVSSGLLWFRGLSGGHIGEHATAISDFERLLARGVSAETSSTTHGPIPLMTNDYRYILALLNYRAGRYAESIALYREALGNDVGLFMAHVQMGKMYEERQQWTDAIEHFRHAVATNPDDPSLLLDLGTVLREAGNLSESETTLRSAMSANGRDTRVLYHLGLTLDQAGKKSEAREVFARFLDLAPSRYNRQITDVQQRLAALQPAVSER